MPAQRIISQAERRAAISAVRRGELTVSEIAELLQVNKSNVSRWCSDVDTVAARRKQVIRVWRRIMGGKKLTKQDLAGQAAYAEGVAARYADMVAEAAE